MITFPLILAGSLLTALARCGPIERTDTGGVVQGVLGTDSFWNECDGGVNDYTVYSGNGSQAAGWPGQLAWVSYSDLWCVNQHIVARSCSLYYNTSDNSDQETADLKDAISVVAHETRVDHRLILAAIMQETKGCVRAATSVSKDGIRNPGILQDFEGTYTCNENGKIQNPCPKDQIVGMIRDGIAGTAAGHGYAADISAQTNVTGVEYAEAYYRAARLYNSGVLDDSNDLEKGVATHCYSSDIANRLTGWVDSPTKCTFDSSNSTAKLM